MGARGPSDDRPGSPVGPFAFAENEQPRLADGGSTPSTPDAPIAVQSAPATDKQRRTATRTSRGRLSPSSSTLGAKTSAWPTASNGSSLLSNSADSFEAISRMIDGERGDHEGRSSESSNFFLVPPGESSPMMPNFLTRSGLPYLQKRSRKRVRSLHLPEFGPPDILREPRLDEDSSDTDTHADDLGTTGEWHQPGAATKTDNGDDNDEGPNVTSLLASAARASFVSSTGTRRTGTSVGVVLASSGEGEQAFAIESNFFKPIRNSPIGRRSDDDARFATGGNRSLAPFPVTRSMGSGFNISPRDTNAASRMDDKTDRRRDKKGRG